MTNSLIITYYVVIAIIIIVTAIVTVVIVTVVIVKVIVIELIVMIIIPVMSTVTVEGLSLPLAARKSSYLYRLPQGSQS